MALLLLAGADPDLRNKVGMNSRQEARGDARKVYQLFDTSNFDEIVKIYPRCQPFAKALKVRIITSNFLFIFL